MKKPGSEGDSSVPSMKTTEDGSVPNMQTTEVSLNQQCCSCDTSSSRCWCVDCGEALCDDCVSAHRRVTVTRSHRILNQPSGNVSTIPTKFCRLHPSEPLKLFCRTCFQYTCRDCQLIGHMNHRYLFVSDALNHTRKQLVTWTQPIRAQGDTASRSLKDMQTRLQQIKEGESQLEAELEKSFNICAQLLKNRMDNLMEEVKRELKSESDLIQKQMEKLNQLQKKQILVTESLDRAQNVQDLQSLFRCCTQVKAHLKDLQDQDLSPPETMQLLQVTVDRQSLDTLLNFGKLEVEKIPFSIPQTSNQNPPPTSTCPTPSSMPPSPQTTATSVTAPPISVSGSSVLLQLLSTQLSLLPASGQNLNQPTPPVTTSLAVTCTKHVPPLSSSTLESGSPSQRNTKLVMVLNPVSSLVSRKHITSSSIQSTDQSSYCTVLKPSLVLKQTSVSDQNQPSTACWPHSVSAVMPHLGLERNSALPLGRRSVPAESCQWRRPVCSAGHSQCVGQGHKVLPKHHNLTHSSSAPPAQLTLMCDTNGKRSEVPFSSSLKHRQIPVRKEVADSACDHTEQQRSTRQEEPPGSRPTSTLCEETKPTSTLCEETKPAQIKPTSTLCEETKPTSTLCEETKLLEEKSTFNRPTFIVSEETEPAKKRPNFNKPSFIDSEGTESRGKRAQTTDRTAEDLSSVIGLHDFCLSKRQPRVSLLRLPLSLLPTQRSLPGVVARDADDEISLEELDEDCQSHISDISEDFGDFTEPLSSPESPVTLEIVYCSACGSDNSSIICSSCGRGYHRDCHIPPVGPDMWTEWNCSLCQDLSDPSDPYRSKRPKIPQGPCLSLMDQRRCESVLLHLKVEGCSRLSKWLGRLESETDLGTTWAPAVKSEDRVSQERRTGGSKSQWEHGCEATAG